MVFLCCKEPMVILQQGSVMGNLNHIQEMNFCHQKDTSFNPTLKSARIKPRPLFLHTAGMITPYPIRDFSYFITDILISSYNFLKRRPLQKKKRKLEKNKVDVINKNYLICFFADILHNQPENTHTHTHKIGMLYCTILSKEKKSFN